MAPSFRIDSSVFFLWALALLILPLDWLLAAALAAGFHELFHLGMMHLLHVHCLGIHIGAGGIGMQTQPMERWEELLCAAAGPIGSLSLLCVSRAYPQLAVCAGVQGLYNLLPIYPSDGGRILRCLVGERACKITEIFVSFVLAGVGVWLAWKYELGILPVFLSIFVLGKAFLRKIPCKADKLGVQ